MAKKPPKYSEAIRDEIAGMIEEGRLKPDICRAVGITARTWKTWEDDHEDFRASLELARDWIKESVILGLMGFMSDIKAGEIDGYTANAMWKTMQWTLEKADPDSFGPRSTLKIEEGNEFADQLSKARERAKAKKADLVAIDGGKDAAQ